MSPAPSLAASEYLDFEATRHRDLFDPDQPAWLGLRRLAEYLRATIRPGVRGKVIGHAHIDDDVEIGEGTIVEPGAVIRGPAIIGRNCTVRTGCFVRENVIAGDGVFLGNSSEFKNCIIFDESEIPHFNYVGDSVLGRRAHLGAGAIIANFRLDRDLSGIRIRTAEGETIATGLDKFGAVIGDRTDIGCNSVISPGSLIGRDCMIYPGAVVRSGILPARRIVKVRQQIEIVEKRAET